MSQKAGRPPVGSFWCHRLRAWINQDSCFWTKGGVSGDPIPESYEVRALSSNVQNRLKACRLEFFIKGRTLIDVSVRHASNVITGRANSHCLVHGQATCADAIASVVGAVKGGDSWMRALGLQLTGRPEVIVQGKGSTRGNERGHTQQALTSSDQLEAKLIRFLWVEVARWEDPEAQPYEAKQLRSNNTQDQHSHADMSPSDRRTKGLFSILSDDDSNALNVATFSEPKSYQRLTIGKGEVLLVNGKLMHGASSVQGAPKTRIWIGMGEASK